MDRVDYLPVRLLGNDAEIPVALPKREGAAICKSTYIPAISVAVWLHLRKLPPMRACSIVKLK